MNKLNRFVWLFLPLVASLIGEACKKANVDKEERKAFNNDITPTNNRVELSNDSIFRYAEQIYYWNDLLPTYKAFNPRQYTQGSTDLIKYQTTLNALIRQSKSPDYDPINNVSKYSYIEDIRELNTLEKASRNFSSVETSGIGNDIGIRLLSLIDPRNQRYESYVSAVDEGSPADNANIKRGFRITKINGKAIGQNFSAERNLLIQIIEGSNSVQLEFAYTHEGKNLTYSASLQPKSYKSSPVYKDTILTQNNTKIGYLALARFSNLSNSNPDNPSDENLDPVFERFATAGISNLIIDLRYNGGGIVQTAEHLINLIVPSSVKNTDVMYTELYNPLMQKNGADILANQPLLDENGKLQYIYEDNKPKRIATYFDLKFNKEDQTRLFNKKGKLFGIKNVSFITTAETASASELTINCLKPYVSVKTVGTTSYGKPVGFLPIVLEKNYNIAIHML